MASNDDPMGLSLPLTPLTPGSYNGQDSEHRRLITADTPPSPSLRPSKERPLGGKDSKILLERRFLRGVLSGTWFVHLLAVLFTGGVVQFTFRNFYWFDEDNWDSQLLSRYGVAQDVAMNGLQFVAKVHEIIIVASVSAMVMHFCRRMLVGDGIAFGFLTGAYQISSATWLFSKNYLWSAMPRLWRTDGKRYISSWKHLLMGLGAAAICIYCNMVGPSSAVVIIPELAWWEVENPFHGNLETSYIGSPPNVTYPAALTNSLSFPSCEFDNEEDAGTTQTYCPGYGYDELAKWAESFSLGGPSSVMDITQQRSGVRRELTSATFMEDTSQRTSTNKNLLAVATTPHSSLTELAGAFWSYVEANNFGHVANISRPRISPIEDVFSPLVQVQCKWFVFTDARNLRRNHTPSTGTGFESPHFDTAAILDFSSLSSKKHEPYQSPGSTEETWLLPEPYWNRDRNITSLQSTNFTWVDARSIFPNNQFSLASVVEVPLFINAQDSLIIPCVMDARWAGVDLTLDPSLDRLFRQNLSDLTKTLGDFWGPGKTPKKSQLHAIYSQTIPISLDWADFLNKPIKRTLSGSRSSVYNTTTVSSLMEKFVYKESNESNTWRSFKPPLFKPGGELMDVADDIGRTVARVLSHVLADGISRVSYEYDLALVLRKNGTENVDFVDLTNISGGSFEGEQQAKSERVKGWTPIRWTLRKYGYGYGFVSRTVTFGVVILLVHGASVLLYTLYILSFRLSPYGWSSSAWGGMEGILLLAITSRPSSTTENTGTGIMSNRLFRARARVRERGQGSVELLVGEDGVEEHKLIKGNKYL